MIERIEIAGCASFGKDVEIMEGLSTFNFIYGPNGSGKTTLSRLIGDESRFPDCSIRWRSSTKLETLVYNRDFVENNLNQPTGFKGIFTLGEKDIDTLSKITGAKHSLNTLIGTIETLSQTLAGLDGKGGKRAELEGLENGFKDNCWELKKKHDAKLQGALTGFRGDAQKFKDKLLLECEGNYADLLEQIELERKAETVFGPSPITEQLLLPLESAALLAWEKNPILKKRVLGKADVDIADMIQRLGNSDWVKQGVEYLAVNERYCPFCQQKAPEELSQTLEHYFDEAFVRDHQVIEELYAGYKLEGERLKQFLQSTIATKSKFLETEKLRSEKDILDARFHLNVQRIETKRKEPSQIIELEPLDDVLATAKQLIAEAITKIQAHNVMVDNLTSERAKLTAQVWKFFTDVEIVDKFKTYKQKKTAVEAAIVSLEGKVMSANIDKAAIERDIRQLEKSTTSIQPTVSEINKILKSFGFRTFSLATSDDSTYYVIRRQDGSDAKETLSEGERSFIAFLYFCHLLKGSETSSGMTANRVVVFDDPVSSLDSDVLFIVGSLIKGLFEDVRTNSGYIKQIFVLTHNVYFHKEVTFNSRRTGGAMNEETFWTVSKFADVSKVKKHDSNPIKTSYDLLWTDVRARTIESQTLQNTLRRILESYFRILGNMDAEVICGKFDGNEKLVCRSLFSWANMGSHSDQDDLYISADGTANERYLGVFRKIFDKMDHLSHYKMMMGDAYVDETI